MSFETNWASIAALAKFTDTDKKLARLFYYHGVREAYRATVEDLQMRIHVLNAESDKAAEQFTSEDAP